MLLMDLESRPVVFEDIGRQVLATGTRKQTEEFIDKIRSITAKDIQRVVSRMLKTKPAGINPKTTVSIEIFYLQFTVYVVGNVKKIQSYQLT